ncbi:MAG: B12-binding domain-containing radical SAM protein [Thermodesulfobacteriota bacterium]
MKFLLIQPPYPFSEFPKPSLALMSLGAVLKENDVEVKVLDLLATRFSWSKIEDSVNRFQPDLIGITSVTMNFPVALKIIKYCKKISPETLTIMGGPHVTFMAEEVLQQHEEVDIIVQGEGEETVKEICRLAPQKELAKIKGIAFRQNGKMQINEDRPFIGDLNLLPNPERTLFPISRYLAMKVPASILTSRGCPVGCSFCVGYRMTGQKGRFRDPQRVVDEIEAALNLGFEEVCFDDDLFTRQRSHVLGVCQEIKKRGLRFPLYLFARVDTVDEPILRELRSVGCSMICFGLESGNQKILDQAHKRITLAKIRQAIEICKQVGISPFGSFILGLPGETRETMEETLAFAQSLGIPYGFHLLAPFPGTRVRERAAEYGLKILTDDWSLYDADHAVTETAELPAKAVEEFAQKFFSGLNKEIERMKQATLAGAYNGPYKEEMEKRLEIDFAWQLLSRDLLEEKGEIKNYLAIDVEDSLKKLAEELARETSYPLPFVEKKLADFFQKRLIICQNKADSFKWHWRDD